MRALSTVSMMLILVVMVAACTPAPMTPAAPAAAPTTAATTAPEPTAEPTAAPEPTAASETAAQDIVDTAVADGRFKTLVAAVQAAELVDTLKGDGPFTVFAPTDDAFAKLPAGTVEGLLAEPAKLKDILLYHVVPGKVMAADVVNLTSADTALGKPLAIKVEDGKVMINDALVTITDIETKNGVIHVIDSVILPPAE